MATSEELSLVPNFSLPNDYIIESVRKAQRKKAAAKYFPSWEEIWTTGWDNQGKHKNGIFQMSLSDTDRERLREVKAALEGGDLSRLPEKAAKPISKSEALALYPTLVEAKRVRLLAEMVAKKPDNYIIVTTDEQFREFMRLLPTEAVTALDTETNGLDKHGKSEIVGISVTLPIADLHYYVPVAHKTDKPQLNRKYVLETMRPWFEDWRARKVLHNSPFDAHMLSQHGIALQGIHADTQFAQKILNENEESVALKNLANKYGYLFGYEDDSYKYEELFGKNTPFDEVDYVVGGIYAAKDTHLTWLLYKWQRTHFDRLPGLRYIYDKIENPLIPARITMERTGFLIDQNYAKEFGIILQAQISKLLSKMRELFCVNGEFNFDSPQQLSALLYDELKLTNKKKGSVDAGALKFIQHEHEGVPLILEYREKTKLYSTYVEALPKLINADGRLRGEFDQVGTVTGRFSSREPNLQNLPPEGRKLIIAPKRYVILGSDFSQIEPRVLAHISGDKKLQQIYKDGKDLYAQLASDVFKLPIEQCLDGCKPPGWKKEPRKMMKVGLLAVMYGISMYSLKESLGMNSVEEAQQFINDFYATYPDVYRWVKSVYALVKNQEYVETMYGRKRRFPGHKEKAIIYDQCAAEICQRLGVDELPLSVWEGDIQRKNEGLDPLLPYKLKRRFQDVKGDVERVRRMAVNAVIQGTAADIMKLALIELHKYTEAKGWRVAGTVHDEALSEVPETITLAEVEEMESLMTGVAELDVPLKCDTEIFKRWGEGISKREWFKEAA
ncbi:DNA polymerase [Paenibacillus sp. 1P03SA]|uniref:DNA polymerase n=1 Tax=Paenibacillus sp. 1P03SA TaxID=3132294 RepID=UPI0039A10A98